MKHLNVVLCIALSLFLASGSADAVTKTLVGNGKTISVVTGTYAASQIDTVKWTREAGVTAISFAVYVSDTADIDANTYVRRVVNGVLVTAITADTLANAEAIDVNAAAASLDAVTLAPLADEYWFIVPYASSGNDTQGTAVVRYELIKQYAK